MYCSKYPYVLKSYIFQSTITTYFLQELSVLTGKTIFYYFSITKRQPFLYKISFSAFFLLCSISQRLYRIVLLHRFCCRQYTLLQGHIGNLPVFPQESHTKRDSLYVLMKKSSYHIYIVPYEFLLYCLFF